MPPIYRLLEVALFSLLNFLPFLALAMYPFRRHLRFSNAVTNICVVGMCLIQILIGYAAAFSPLGSGIMSAVSTVVYAAFLLFVTKDRVGRLLFVLLALSNIGNLVTVFAKFLEGHIFGDIALEPYRWSLCVCILILHVVITIPVAIYVRKYFTSSVPIQTDSWHYLWIIPATFFVTWYYHLYFTGQDTLRVVLDIHNAIFILVINLGAFVVYHTAILLLFEQQKASQLAQENHLLAMHKLQYDTLQYRINEARQAKHDVRHHTHLIREYLRSGKLQELDTYLENYSHSLPDTQSLTHCQHYATNALLNYFVQQAADNNIKMDIFVQLPETVALPETTLSVLLGNLLENAIDACNELPCEERKITVRGKVNNGFVYFDISNNYSGILKKNKSGEFLSTKMKGHGLGLHSVAQLVRYHNGIYEVDTSNNVFRVSVILQEQ